MVYKVWNSSDPRGDPQSLDNYAAFYKNCLRGGKGLLCERFMEQFNV